jgi:hypothetical protein
MTVEEYNRFYRFTHVNTRDFGAFWAHLGVEMVRTLTEWHPAAARRHRGTGARMRGLPQGARMVTLPFRVLDNVGLSQFARMPLENLLGALPRTCGMQGWP